MLQFIEGRSDAFDFSFSVGIRRELCEQRRPKDILVDTRGDSDTDCGAGGAEGIGCRGDDGLVGMGGGRNGCDYEGGC